MHMKDTHYTHDMKHITTCTHMHMKDTHFKEVNWLQFPVFRGHNVRIPCISTMAIYAVIHDM